MDRASIELVFNNLTGMDERQYMRTAVDPAGTDPEVLKQCLVVEKGSEAADERLVQVASYADVITTPLPDLPGTLDVFSSSLYPHTLVLNDVIHVLIGTVPMWNYFLNVPGGDYQVTVVEDLGTYVRVSPAFPSFARDVSFYVDRVGISGYTDTVMDGLCTRNYAGTPGVTKFLVTEHNDVFNSIAAAQNKFVSLQAEAQALITDYNKDRWSGTYRRTFT